MSPETVRAMMAEIAGSLPWENYKYGITKVDGGYVVSWDYPVNDLEAGEGAEARFRPIILATPDIARAYLALVDAARKVIALAEDGRTVGEFDAEADAAFEAMVALVTPAGSGTGEAG